MAAELRSEVAGYKAATFSENTKRTYASHLKSYMEFCKTLNCIPVPAEEENVCMYAAYLSRRIKYNSLRQYLNIVRLLHIENGYPNPLDCWSLKSTLRGIKRLKGDSVERKEPVTPLLLLKLYRVLDSSNVLDMNFWAACLVMFFGTFRKSNLFPDSKAGFDSSKQFTRSDFVVTVTGHIYITVRWTKTIQCRERSYQVKLPYFDHPLSPAKAVAKVFEMCKLGPNTPAFVSNRSGSPMTGSGFNRKLCKTLEACGCGSGNYSSHSFRRGSAVWAIQCGLPTEMVKFMGDWKSAAYLNYVDALPKVMKESYCKQFCAQLPLHL